MDTIHSPPNVCEKSLLVIALAIELAIRSVAIAVDGPNEVLCSVTLPKYINQGRQAVRRTPNSATQQGNK